MIISNFHETGRDMHYSVLAIDDITFRQGRDQSRMILQDHKTPRGTGKLDSVDILADNRTLRSYYV